MKKWHSCGRIRASMAEKLKDIFFKDFVFSRSYASRAEYHAALANFCGSFNDPKFDSRLSDLIKLWRTRLSELRENNWHQLDSTKYGWARNCLPCCLKSKHGNTNICRVRICPFCYGRNVGAFYNKLATHLTATIEQEESLQLYTYSYMPSKKTLNYPIFAEQAANVPVIKALMQKLNTYRNSFKTKIAIYGKGGFYSINAEPCNSDSVRDGVIGYWRLHLRGVLVANTDIPQSDNNAAKITKTHVSDKVNFADLSYSVGTLFRYPKGWMTGPPNGMALFLNASRNKRYSANFGVFRKPHNLIV